MTQQWELAFLQGQVNCNCASQLPHPISQVLTKNFTQSLFSEQRMETAKLRDIFFFSPLMSGESCSVLFQAPVGKWSETQTSISSFQKKRHSGAKLQLCIAQFAGSLRAMWIRKNMTTSIIVSQLGKWKRKTFKLEPAVFQEVHANLMK